MSCVALPPRTRPELVPVRRARPKRSTGRSVLGGEAARLLLVDHVPEQELRHEASRKFRLSMTRPDVPQPKEKERNAEEIRPHCRPRGRHAGRNIRPCRRATPNTRSSRGSAPKYGTRRGTRAPRLPSGMVRFRSDCGWSERGRADGSSGRGCLFGHWCADARTRLFSCSRRSAARVGRRPSRNAIGLRSFRKRIDDC